MSVFYLLVHWSTSSSWFVLVERRINPEFYQDLDMCLLFEIETNGIKPTKRVELLLSVKSLIFSNE